MWLQIFIARFSVVAMEMLSRFQSKMQNKTKSNYSCVST